MRGDINNWGDGLKYFVQGAIVGFALGFAWQFAPLITLQGTGQGAQNVMTLYAVGQAGLGVAGTAAGAFNGGWRGVGNGAKAFWLVSDSSSNVVFRTRQYDGYGRLYRDRDSGPDGKWLEKTYSYSGGNISSIQFNSHSGAVGTESCLYGYGNLKEITFDGVSVWKLNTENAMGIPVSVTTGNIIRSCSL